MNIIAVGKRVYLRELNEDDAPFMHDLMNQRKWLDFIGDRGISSLAKAKAHIESGPCLSYQVNGFGLYLVVGSDNEQSIGVCGLLKRTYLDAPDLGFAISERYYQRGFGYEAAELVLQVANKLTGASCIYASVNKVNLASCSLLEKLGFTLHSPTALQSLGSDADDLLLYAKDMSSQGK